MFSTSFEEATQAFNDTFRIRFDERIVDSEIRWLTFGMVRGVMLLMVAHTLVDDWESVVRIISARLATRKERNRYENENG